MKNSYKILDRKPQKKMPLGKHKRRWKDNIKTNLKETRCEGLETIKLDQDTAQW